MRPCLKTKRKEKSLHSYWTKRHASVSYSWARFLVNLTHGDWLEGSSQKQFLDGLWVPSETLTGSPVPPWHDRPRLQVQWEESFTYHSSFCFHVSQLPQVLDAEHPLGQLNSRPQVSHTVFTRFLNIWASGFLTISTILYLSIVPQNVLVRYLLGLLFPTSSELRGSNPCFTRTLSLASSQAPLFRIHNGRWRYSPYTRRPELYFILSKTL